MADVFTPQMRSEVMSRMEWLLEGAISRKGGFQPSLQQRFASAMPKNHTARSEEIFEQEQTENDRWGGFSSRKSAMHF